eukprot:1656750-Pyramimonas_sp.AAC.1
MMGGKRWEYISALSNQCIIPDGFSKGGGCTVWEYFEMQIAGLCDVPHRILKPRRNIYHLLNALFKDLHAEYPQYVVPVAMLVMPRLEAAGRHSMSAGLEHPAVTKVTDEHVACLLQNMETSSAVK